MDPGSVFWEKCARHTNSQTARNLAYVFLCDACAERLRTEALNDRAPVFRGGLQGGYCGLCNDLREVRFLQWFACQVCWNVVVAYQKSIVAAQSVRDFWNSSVQPANPAFDLQELDEMQLLPYLRKGRTKRQAAEELEGLDFLAIEASEGVAHPRFHIELKSGPGAIPEMTRFQLDVNDFNDIAGAALNTELPAYVFHAQVELDYVPPTRRAVCRGLWWTDVLRLQEHLRSSATRRDEAKKALYFDTAAFRPMEEFPSVVAARRFEVLWDEIRRSNLALVD
jgi:hypothetical protein